MNFLNWSIFIVVILLVAVYTIKLAKKVKNKEEYFVTDRKTRLFALTATLVMTELNTSTLLGFSGMGYQYGYSAVSLALVFLFGLLFYTLVAAKKWKNFNGISVTEFFTKRYNTAFGYFSAIILILAMLGFSANYVKSLSLIFEPVFHNLNGWLVTGIFCLIMILLTIRKGLASIIRIDVLSFCLTVSIFIILLFLMPADSNSIVLTKNTGNISCKLVIGLTIITMFTYIMSPWYGQKIFSAVSSRTAFYGVGIAAIIICFVYGVAIYISASLALVQPHLESQNAIPYIISHNLPTVIQGIAYSILFLVALTTISALWNTIASLVSVHFNPHDNLNSLFSSKILTVVIAIISYILANIFINNIFDKMVLMNIPIAALAFPLLGGFYWKKVSLTPSVISILVGIIGGFWCYFYFGEEKYIWYWAVYVIPLHFLSGIIATWLSKKQGLARMNISRFYFYMNLIITII